MTKIRLLLAAAALCTALIAVGYFSFQYVKMYPPNFLVKLFATAPAKPLPEGDIAPLSVPDGFVATIFARNIKGARVMTRDQKGTILVSQTSQGKIVALPNTDADGTADRAVEVLTGLNGPHGIVFWCSPLDAERCILVVAEETAVNTYTYDPGTHKATLVRKIADLPGGGGHSTRTLMVHPDGEHILISVGSSCNVCEEKDSRRASILKVNMHTYEVTPFASGLRNTVFMTTHYVTGDIWGTDMGRDLIGDDIPPDEINILKEGEWYGWPWFYGKNVADMDFSPNARPSFAQEAIPSHIDLQAHSAPLGLVFVPEEGWPEEWWYDALVAYHGSWNRSVPTGYKVVRFDLSARGDLQGGPHDFITGFAPQGGGRSDAIGRPVDMMIEPGGTLYLSDDHAGAIYRIARTALD